MAVAIGKLDALMFAIGIMLGTLVFGDILFPYIKDFYYSGSLGRFTLNELLGWNTGVVAFVVVVIAVVSFWLSERAERSFHPYRNLRSPETKEKK